MKYENPFGVYVTGIDRTEEADSIVLKSRKKIFSYVGAVMTLPTGVQAVSAARYGSGDQSLAYVKKLERSFSYALPGSMYEVSPDFGMVTQAWNIYAVAVPIVNYYFGVQPYAQEKKVVLSPQLPSDWKDVSLEHVVVGDNAISIFIKETGTQREYRITSEKADWTIMLNIGDDAKSITVNNTPSDLPVGQSKNIALTGNENRVIVNYQ